MDVQYLREIVREIVSDKEMVHLVYLFGSRLDGQLGPLSDYDFAVLLSYDMNAFAEQTRLTHELALVLGTDKVDVVALNNAPIELAYAVVAQGQILYEISVEERVEYEAQVLGLYGDYLPVLRQQRTDILGGRTSDAGIQRYRAAFGRTERTLAKITAAAK